MKTVKYPLDAKEVIAYKTTKKNIVIHGSFSRTIHTPFQGNGRDTQIIDTWNSLPEKYGCAYLIGVDGTCYETYNDDYWTNHLNLPRQQYLDKQSVGICLANELFLTKNGSRYYAFGTDKPYNYYDGEVYEKQFRGYDYWAKVKDIQIESLADTILSVCAKHIIVPKFYNGSAFNQRSLDVANIVVHSVLSQNVFDLPIDERFAKIFESKGIGVVKESRAY